MRPLLLLFSVYFMVGCRAIMHAKYAEPYEQEAYYESDDANQDFSFKGNNYGAYGGEDQRRSASAVQSTSLTGGMTTQDQQNTYSKYKDNNDYDEKTGEKQAQQPAARMVHYNGYANLHVARPEEVVEEIVALSKTYKGNIERRSTQSITIRVPKDSFSDAFNEIIKLGDVLNKSVTSEDVTEAFTSVELRLKTAQTTRDRLLALLERAKDEEEKIKILRQLQRLNEQIDIIEAQMRTLKDLSDFSSISVDLTAKQAVANGAQQVEAVGFSWIHNLSPFENSVCHSGKRLELSTPDEFVALHPKGAYIAESADGTVLRATRLKNDPQGSSGFWHDSIQKRLASGYGKTESKEIGQFQSITLFEDSDNPYIWIIAVRDAGKYIEVVEAYFPNKEQLKRHQDSVVTAITGGAQ